MAFYQFEMPRGDTFEFDLAITRSGTPVDLTGATLWMTAKRNHADADAAAVFQKGNIGPLTGITITGSPLLGVCRVTVVPADTNPPKILDTEVLVWDLQLKEASGRVTTVAEGSLAVLVDVTQAT